VPTIRTLNEDLLMSLYDCGLLWMNPRDAASAVRAHLVRINPDPLLAGIVRQRAQHLAPFSLIPLRLKAKEAMEKLSELQEREEGAVSQ